METLTEFFRELVVENETILKESTKHFKSADKALKRELGQGKKVHIQNRIEEKERESEAMRDSLKSVDYYKKMMVAAKGILMPSPTIDLARVYTGSDGHPRICKEFDFLREDGVLTNRVRISSLLGLVEWSMQNKVTMMDWPSVRYLDRPRKNLAIPPELLQWMIDSADWWTAVIFCKINAKTAYSMIRNNVGRYAGVDGHRNVVCGCAYDSKYLQFVVSTARPHLQSWLRVIDLSGPIVLHQNTIYVPDERFHGKWASFHLVSAIGLSGQCSRTYDRGPKRFHKCAARSIHFESSKPIKESWS